MLTTSLAKRLAHLLGALPIDVEQHVPPLGEHRFDRRARGAVAIAVDLGRFEEVARALATSN